MVSPRDLEQALDRLRLRGSAAVVHTSLRRLGGVDGGSDAVARVVADMFGTALLPAFSFASNAPPPPGDRPARNGCDYTFYDRWNAPPAPFRLEEAGIDISMGAVARRFAALPGVRRSSHPLHSWIARGAAAEDLVRPHPWDTTNPPLERLAAIGGVVVLIGVGLNSCTAVHVAEERAGRQPFIRWAWDRDGVVRRVRVAGCSKGFERLRPHVADLFEEAPVGDGRVQAAPLAELIERCADAIRADPRITVCSEGCLRCRDSALGGPAA